MSRVKSVLKDTITGLGGTPTAKSIPGLYGELAVALGGTNEGRKTVAAQLENVAKAMLPPEDDSETPDTPDVS